MYFIQKVLQNLQDMVKSDTNFTYSSKTSTQDMIKVRHKVHNPQYDPDTRHD